MESGQVFNKDMMQVNVASEAINNRSQVSPTSSSGSLTRQSSASKTTCLCSPTSHAGSFRCRLHRTPSLQRTKSNIDSGALRDSPAKVNAATVDTSCNADTVEAQ